MIAKIPKRRKDGRSSFHDLVQYIVGDGEGAERAVYHQTRNMNIAENDIDLAIAEMEGLGIQNVRCKDPVFHYILSFRQREVPTNRQVDEAVEISLRELGLEKCKALYGLQNDTGIHHIHVCACRVDPTTEKAVLPASGWSKKALTKAARKIEIMQGWEVERSDPFWDVTDDGKIVKKDRTPGRDEAPKLDESARDLETHTGEKSAQTLAIEKGADILRAAGSWQELHNKLFEVGLEFKKKGSGAIIVVGDDAVKASSIGQNYSLSKLEKRLGEFIGREAASTAESTTVPQPPEPTKQTETTPETLSAWKRYQIYKEDYLAQKEKRNVAFARCKVERDELKKLHKAERDRLFETNWKGCGAELNQERRIIAATQLQGRLRLKKKHDDERKAFEKNEVTPQKFLSYRKWLSANQPELISDLRNWRENERKKEELSQTPVLQIYNPDMEEKEALRLKMFTTLRFESENEHEKSEPSLKNFAAYRIWKHNDGKTLSYSLEGEKTAFVERRDEITVFHNTESSLLAAMQLGQNKWGIVKLEGTKKNLDICVMLAEEYNIKIQVPKEYLENLENEKRIRDEQTHEQAETAAIPQDATTTEPPIEEIAEHESYLEMDDLYGEILSNKNSERCRSRYHPIHEKIKRLDEIVFYVKEQSRGTPVDVDYLEEFRYAHKISKLTTLDAQRMEDRNDRGR